MRHYMLGLLGAMSIVASSASAETCGGIYEVKRGDSLSRIADDFYKNASMWTTIQQNNLDKIGSNPNSITVGMKLNLLCLNGLPVGLEGGVDPTLVAAPAVPLEEQKPEEKAALVTPGAVRRISLITGDDYAPFTDRRLDQGGLMTELVTQAMTKANPAEGFVVEWINDWNSHIYNMLPSGLVDMTFPWTQPTDCAAIPDDFHCVNFLRSEPMFEQLVLVYYAKERPFVFEKDEDMEGHHVCRPTGYPLWDMDQYGRNWLKDSKIKLEQPLLVADCFNMLLEGKVEAVLIDEFAGRASVAMNGMLDKIAVADRPMHIEALHVLVHKSNPKAEEMMAMINSGLDTLKSSGEYQAIVGRHMARFWAEQQGG